MNKFFTRIVGAALGLAMAIGVGVAVSSNKGVIPTFALDKTYTKVSSIDDLSTGDNVILAQMSSSNPSVGVSSTSSVATSSTEADWVIYKVTKSGTTFTLLNEASNKYVTATGTNGATFGHGASGSTLHVGDGAGSTTGVLYNTNNRFLGQNGANTKFYASSNLSNYPNYYVWKVAASKTPSSVDVQTQPTKLEYKIGEAFDPSGLVVRVTYTDETYDDVTYSSSNSSKFEFAGFNSSSAVDNQQVTVKYTPAAVQFTCSTKVNVSIIEVNPNAILVDASSIKKDYRVGQTLDLTDLVITVGFDDDSDETYTIESNADFISKGFSLKLSESNFDLSTALTMSHNGASFVVYFGELNDSSDTIDITVENVATITLSDASTSTFWSSGSNNSYENERAGVVGNGTQFQAFEGKWYINGGFQMNALDKNSYISNITALGTIKTIVISANSGNATYFSMYYGSSVNPNVNKVTASVSSNTWTYDFTNKNATFFKLAKDVTKGSVVMTSIAITYTVNDSLDRTQPGAFSQYFLDITSNLCDANGVNNGVADVWDKISGVYALLLDSTKAALKAKAQASGGFSDGTTVGNAMARYYWAVNNHGANTDFIGDVSNGAKLVNGLNDKDNSTVIIVTIIMASCLVIVSGCFFIRRRKQR
ncbi:MAG: bacterial Ig-like domain-containing protein [Bacilli bacterium]|nr:bacterial Ig-like domain-containing protein [Bacilli bacterium]